MTPDEARDLFSAAHDRELTSDVKRAFDVLLSEDVELAAEYAAFCQVLSSASAPLTDAPNLLPGVQKKLRSRSRGKFYRDAFSEHAGVSAQRWIILFVALLAVAVVCAYFALSATVLP